RVRSRAGRSDGSEVPRLTRAPPRRRISPPEPSLARQEEPMETPDRPRSSTAIPRRAFLKTASAVGFGAAAGLEGVLAARRAPAFGQTTRLHLLQWVDFIPEGDTEVRRQLVEYKKIGAALKKKGKPVGQTLGHTFGDAPAWTYPFTWTFGGAETDASGKKVVLNSKGTVEAVTWMTDFWKVACDESALAWDDTNNNRAFHAGEISATLNGASIYIYAKRNPDKIKDERGEPMWRDISHFAIPNGPGGRTPPYAVAFSHGLMQYSKNQKAAREFFKWFHGKEMVGKWFEIESGYAVGAGTSWENHPMWERLA